MRLRVAVYAFSGLVLAASSAFAYLYFRNPATAPPLSIKVDMTADRLARGEYLFRLADCDGCHSERDFSRFGGPVVPSGRGRAT